MIRLMERVFNTPLMMEKTKAQMILDVLAPKFGMTEGSYDIFDKNAALFGEFRTDPTQITLLGNVAVVPILGTIVHRTLGVNAASGLISTQQIASMLLEAASDDSVEAILLDIDSGGGEVNGIFDLADMIREINDSTKPVYAIANSAAFSAAYALASAAQEIYVSRTSGVGSIGVFAEHVSFARANDMAGIEVTPVYAGDYKVERSQEVSLSEEAKARIQAEVDDTYDLFVSQVARMRGLPVEAVIDTQAGLFFGADAVESGLADAVLNFDEAVESILNKMGDNEMINEVEETAKKHKDEDMRLFSKTGKGQKAEMESLSGEKEAALTEMDPAAQEKTEKEVEAQAEVEAEAAEAQVEEQEAEAEAEEAEAVETEAEAEEAQAEETLDKAAADPAEVVRLAIEAGCPEKAPDLIEEKLSLEEVKSELDKTAAITDLCQRAGMPGKAQGFLDKGLSVDEVREKLFDSLARQAAKSDVSTKADADSIDNDQIMSYAEKAEGKNLLLADAERRQGKFKK